MASVRLNQVVRFLILKKTVRISWKLGFAQEYFARIDILANASYGQKEMVGEALVVYISIRTMSLTAKIVKTMIPSTTWKLKPKIMKTLLVEMTKLRQTIQETNARKKHMIMRTVPLPIVIWLSKLIPLLQKK